MKVAVIGDGTMGLGIAQAFAVTEGFEVTLCSLPEAVGKGRERIAKSLEKLVEKGKLEAATAKAAVERIKSGISADAAGADLVVEAIFEDMAAKRKLFTELQKLCRPETIFASNTSSLSLTEMSAGLDRGIVGMHFFNPVPVMKPIEISWGLQADPAQVEKVRLVTEQIGKVPVMVKEAPGFIVNRILVPMINEAVGILAEGLATAEDIDAAMKLGANHPMGPLALGDLIGLDVCLAILETLYEEMGDDKYSPHYLLRKMVRAQQLGRKTGKGFFDYPK